MILIAIAALMIAGVSSWLNVAGIAGASAIAQHLNSAILSYEAVLSERQSALARVKAVIPDFEQAAALYRTRRESEITSGAYSRGPGPGTREKSLGAIAERFAAQGQTLADQISDRQPAMAVAQKTLDTLRATAAGGQDAAIKLQGFARQTDALLAALAEADPRPLVESVNRTLAAIPNEARLQGITARTEAGAARQRAALDRIAEEVGETSTALSSALAALTADIGPAPGFTRIDPVEAVLRYPLQNAPYWIGGLAMDFAPTLVLIYALVIMQIRGRPGLFAERVGALTVEDILSADYAKDAIRNGAIDGEVITRGFRSSYPGRRA